MTRTIRVVCLLSALSLSAAIVHTAPAQTSDAQAAVSTAPVAFVYVSGGPADGLHNKINAFTAAASGKLTPVPGSPFSGNVNDMAVNGKYLFGFRTDDIYVPAFSIQSNGALKWVKSTNVAAYDPSGCGHHYYPPLILDRTGSTVYITPEAGPPCGNSVHQSFAVDKLTGALHFLGNTSEIVSVDSPLSFSANNIYAYGADCTFHVYKRGSNGLLTLTAINPPLPPPPAGDVYCGFFTAIDTANHVAVAVQALNPQNSPDGPARLAIYTADSSGNLTTASTTANMPAVKIPISALSMSPSGKLLAVCGAFPGTRAGPTGLLIFHVNGGSPITPYTGLLTTDVIDQCFWDNANHLYTISQSSGKLRVFTITLTAHSQAPGSPYAIRNPAYLIVQPR
jgi:hypothetical protein